MTDDAFRRTIANAAAVVRSWPAWKRNLLSHSASPTVSVPRQPVDNSGLQRKERDPMTDSEMIDELTTLEAAATPLPWSHSPSTSAGFEAQVWDHEGQALLFFADERYTGAQADSDAAVIVAVRNALPRLLALARRYDASLKLLRQCDQTFRRFGWEDGENGEAQNEVHRAVRDLLRSETLEAEIARAALATPQDGGQS